jgi:hypothetical protein
MVSCFPQLSDLFADLIQEIEEAPPEREHRFRIGDEEFHVTPANREQMLTWLRTMTIA